KTLVIADGDDKVLPAGELSLAEGPEVGLGEVLTGQIQEQAAFAGDFTYATGPAANHGNAVHKRFDNYSGATLPPQAGNQQHSGSTVTRFHVRGIGGYPDVVELGSRGT